MAKPARQTVFEGMELVPAALAPFVEQRLKAELKGYWQVQVAEKIGLHANSEGNIDWDQQNLFKCMNTYWSEAFAKVLGPSERSYISELRVVRNKLAHNDRFSYDDAERALDSMRRLLEAAGASAAAGEIGIMRDAMLRAKFASLQSRKLPSSDPETINPFGLAPWREVIEPHQDVAKGEFQQAEFAADLAKVHNGSAAFEYLDPHEFYSRTYLTDGLSALLVGAAKRLSGQGGDPVVELQTNFGGGKTHSMLALYHMAGTTPTQDLFGLDQLFAEQAVAVPQTINRAVLVGTSRGPQDVITCDDGSKIRTTWGELAWQLGGAEAFALVADTDASGVAPGSNLLEALFKQCAPCLILIDEWVAYLRQIYRVEGLPSGSFDSNLSFVQSLTEAVKASPQTLLVASLPASQIEVGGEGGQEALQRLKQTFSRVESSWRPASQEESYEIVRRRLFKEIAGDKYPHRDNTIKQFMKMYRDKKEQFPQECVEKAYERKLEKAYPIHPELFDQLYTSWGTLEKFQRTRGVLRFMAQVVHELWKIEESSAMIMPGKVAVGSARAQPELLRYLDENWQSIIASDIDGDNSTPDKIDKDSTSLSKYAATRRIGRTIFLATAPMAGQENPGINDKQINLGVTSPGESPTVFGDALRRLADRARFMHSDLGRYWYATSPNLNRLAADRAEQAEGALVQIEVDKALTTYVNGITDRGELERVQLASEEGSAAIPDEANGLRLVVLGVDHPHSGNDESPAMPKIKEMLFQRGTAPRTHRNTLVFIAVDLRRVDDIKQAMRLALAWEGIVKDAQKSRLDLKKSEMASAEAKVREARETLELRMKDAWAYLIYPYQDSAQTDIKFIHRRLQVKEGLLNSASKTLVRDEVLICKLGPEKLNNDLESYIWKDQPHLPLKAVWEYLNRYIYLPRLKNRQVLIDCIRSALSSSDDLLPAPFAYAQAFDEAKGEYRGLTIKGLDGASRANITIDDDSLLLRPSTAEAAWAKTAPADAPSPLAAPPQSKAPSSSDDPASAPPAKDPTRFQGTVFLSADRPARDMAKVVEAVVDQLTHLPGAEITLRLEIDAEVPSGLERAKVRTLTENTATLGFADKLIS